MVNVAAIPSKNWLMPQEAPDDRKRYIQHWYSHCEERCRHPQDGGGFLAPDHAKTPEQKSNEEAAAVTKEDGRRAKIIAEEAEQGAREWQCSQRQREVAEDQCSKHNRERS